MRPRRLISVRSLLSASLRWPFIRSTEPTADTAEDYRAPPVSRTSTVRQGQSPCKASVFSCIPIDMQSCFFSYSTCTRLTCTSVISPRIFDQNWWFELLKRGTSFYLVSRNSHYICFRTWFNKYLYGKFPVSGFFIFHKLTCPDSLKKLITEKTQLPW